MNPIDRFGLYVIALIVPITLLLMMVIATLADHDITTDDTQLVCNNTQTVALHVERRDMNNAVVERVFTCVAKDGVATR